MLATERRWRRQLLRDPSLVLYLPLNEIDGASFKSSDNYGHLCTVSGATWGIQGRTFDGDDDYINVTHDASQLLTTGGSIEAWIKPDTLGEGGIGRILDKGTDIGATAGYTFLVKATNLVVFRINAGTIISSATNSVIPGDGNYYHVAVTWDATGNVIMYVNGAQSGTPGLTGAPVGITTGNDMRIGNRSTATDGTFDGQIGEVLVYNRAPSAGEVMRNYQATKWGYR